MRSVLLSCISIAKEPPPIVALNGLNATALEIGLQFRVSSPAPVCRIRRNLFGHCLDQIGNEE
jgi:hypothetical protein